MIWLELLEAGDNARGQLRMLQTFHSSDVQRLSRELERVVLATQDPYGTVGPVRDGPEEVRRKLAALRAKVGARG